MKKTQNLTQIMCEIGIFAAIGFIFDEFESIIGRGIFINGGSIGFSMIIVLIIGYRRGFIPALVTGIIMGLFDLSTGAVIIAPGQLFLDYLLPYAAVAFGVIFKPLFDKYDKHSTLFLILGSIIGGAFKFLCHYFSGIIFWADPKYFAWGLSNFSPYLYSFIYNIAFIGPSIILVSLLIILVNKKAHFIFKPKEYKYDVAVSEKINKVEFGESIGILISGTFLFIFFLIDYIKSFQNSSESGQISYTFSQDSMVIMLFGLFLTIIGIVCIRKSYKCIPLSATIPTGISLVSITSLVYSLSMLINNAKNGSYYLNYLIWFFVSLFVILLFLIKYIIKNKKKKSI